MRYLALLPVMVLLLGQPAIATWKKINDVDYIWGPFKIYNISLFSETGEYVEKTRPLMLTLKYAKPVDGRDFAISLARSWSNLGITLQNQDAVVDRLRKILPNIKKDDSLSYIALEDKGYFVLNDIVIPEEFNKEFNDAVVAVWLDPRVEIRKKLITKDEKAFIANAPQLSSSQKPADNINDAETLNKTSSETYQEKQPEAPQNKPLKEEAQNEISEINAPADVSKGTEESKENTEKESLKDSQPQLDDSEIEITPPLDPIPERTEPII